ncbi:MAG: DUF3883 domain-containing protein [Lewinellaceae bacterium]|nr:DUF3883 domain-containing protein [Lewinellaceae bacterium]
MAANWSKLEVEAIVADYFEMLSLELTGESYSKTARRRNLSSQLNSRSKGSIEFKHQNISAVLIKYGFPYILGYKPRSNYQGLLENVILNFLAKSNNVTELFESFAREEAQTKKVYDYSSLLVDPPQIDPVMESESQYGNPSLNKPNYLLIEQQNRSLGEKGEELILNYERWRLIDGGKEKLSESIEWVSKEQGDGAGFDILSKNLNGTDRYIEVKSTKLGEKVPIYFTKNELRFSQVHASDYFLYRVFNLKKKPKFFIKNGAIDSFWNVEPVSFIGRL